MNKLMNLCVVVPVLAGSLLYAAGETLTIKNPATGTGPLWDCKSVDGTTTRCPNATPIRGSLYKLDGNLMWSDARPVGPLFATATNGAGDWNTKPDHTLFVANQFTATGRYRVHVIATLTNGSIHPDDNHYWIIL